MQRRLLFKRRNLTLEHAVISQTGLLIVFSSKVWSASHKSPVLRYTHAMGILRRLSRWMGKQDHMTHIVAGNTAPGFSLKALDNKEYSLNTLLERGPVVAAFFKVSCPFSRAQNRYRRRCQSLQVE